MAEETTPGAGEDDTTPQQGDDQLGDAGKKALEAERAERRKAERRAKELDAELARFRDASMSEQEKAVEAARREARTEAQSSVNRRIVAYAIRAAAGTRLADPEDAVRFLDLDEFEVNEDGDVDAKSIASAVEQLVTQKPYLASGATRPAGDADQGARGKAASGPDMNSLLRAAATGR